MKNESLGPAREETSPASLIKHNQQQADFIIEGFIGNWSKRLKENNTPKMAIRAKQKILELNKPVVVNLIETHSVVDPIDTSFVADLLVLLDGADRRTYIAGEQPQEEVMSNGVQTAIENLRYRIKTTSEAA